MSLTEQTRRWKHLTTYVHQWFHEPPMEALELVLSTYLAHHCLAEEAVWMFLLAPPGYGKTRLLIKPVCKLKNLRPVDSLSSKTFLSGYGSGECGLLKQFNQEPVNHGVIVFSDFSTFLHLDPRERAEIQAQMRVLYDRNMPLTVYVGNKTEPLSWEGKLTCIAACTPQLEHYWSINRELGERWLTYRIPVDSSTQAQKARANKSKEQIGREDEIDSHIEEIIHSLIKNASSAIDTDSEFGQKAIQEVTSIALLVSRLQVVVSRNSTSKVTSVSDAAGAGRMVKSLLQIMYGNVMLFDSMTITQRGLDIAKKVGMDGISTNRYRVVQALYNMPSRSLTKTELAHVTAIPATSLEMTIEDLTEMDLVFCSGGSYSPRITLDDEIVDLMKEANVLPTVGFTPYARKVRKQQETMMIMGKRVTEVVDIATLKEI